MEIPVHIQDPRDGGSVRAFCPDLPGCSATADNADAALEVLRRRVADYFSRDADRPSTPGTRRTVIVL
jgi:hypothetical protein